MLAIRMQRTGRRGHAMFRVIVQDARRTPTSGKVVARLGSYDPHAKTVVLDKEKAAFYLDHGAQPSDRVVRLLKDEGVKLPAWVTPAATKERTVRNPDKRRSTRPAGAEPVAETATKETVETPSEKPATDVEATDEQASEAPTEEITAETPASEAGAEPTAEPEPAAESPEAETAPETPPAAEDSAEKAVETPDDPEAETPDSK